MPETKITKWHNCYDDGWKGLIVPEAFSHPAKMARGLLSRILTHAKEQGWLKEGAVIVDPFGGIGSTGILGAYEGYQVISVELERKFVDLADTNYELHMRKWHKLGCPQPLMLQGDSRQLCQIVEKADCIISSPPYTESMEHSGGIDPSKSKHTFGPNSQMNRSDTRYGKTPGQLGAMKPGKIDCIVSSPPYAGSDPSASHGQGTSRTDPNNPNYRPIAKRDWEEREKSRDYGKTPGQLGSMKPGKVDMVVSSPPYAEAHAPNTSPNDVLNTDRKDLQKWAWNQTNQGQTPGNLGNLKSGDVDVVLSSPPYMLSDNRDGDKGNLPRQGRCVGPKYSDESPCNSTIGGDRNSEQAKSEQMARAQSIKNLGNIVSSGYKELINIDTFWSAAKLIIEQCFQILKPGGHAIWVVKSFVRKGKIVDFPGDWRRLCESAGFKTVCIHQAMLVKETSHQTLFGHTEVKRKERKSFFRRLAESKGSPRIDFEVVLCMQKDTVDNL